MKRIEKMNETVEIEKIGKNVELKKILKINEFVEIEKRKGLKKKKKKIVKLLIQKNGQNWKSGKNV